MTYSEDYSKFYSLKALKDLLKICKNSGLVGISSYASTAPRAIQIVKFLKRNLNIPIIWGGIHATISPQSCIKYLDIVCIGEGEGAILDLVGALEENKSIKKIKNFWVRDKKTGEIIKNSVRSLTENIDRFPFADYDIQNHYILENNRIRNFKEEDFAGQIFFLTGRGCPYGCMYCSNNFLNKLYKGKCKKIIRWHSVDYIINCILDLKKRFRSLSYFDIRDDTFSLRPPNQIKEFCEKYKKKINMRFKCLADPKTVSEEKIKLLVDAGCTDIIVGIQGSERVNKEIYYRNQTDAEALNAAKILNKYKNKLTVMYDVITANPYEEPFDIINMIKLLQKIPKPYFLSVNNLVFFPGTGIYEKAKNDKELEKIVNISMWLNYWDRSKHLLLKKENLYLNLILNLMRGVVTEKRFGIIPSNILNYLLDPKRVRKNLKNLLIVYMVVYLVGFFDLIREKIAKPIFRAMPVNFKVWYDRVRYRV